MNPSPRPLQGLEPTAAELQSCAGCERVANCAHHAFQQGDLRAAFRLLWEAIASISVLITHPAQRDLVTDPELRRHCMKKLHEWGYIRTTEAQTLRAFQAIRDWLVDGAPPAPRRAQEAAHDAAELRKLYREARQIFERLAVELPD